MKTLSKQQVFFISVLGILLFSLIIFFHNTSREISDASLVQVSPSTFIISSPPVRLKIPSIGVDAAIDQVGVNPQGAMDVPKGPATVAWFSLGPRPGELGSAVIDGHSGYKNNKPAVFDNLYKLKIGDKIYVQDSKGGNSTFIVHQFKSYNPKANASDVFVSTDGGSHLNLITCAGLWNPVLKTHSNRLVVFTDKILE